MKHLLVILILAGGLSDAFATITRVNTGSGSTGASTATSFTLALSGTPTAGNWIVGCVAEQGNRQIDVAIGGATVGTYTPRRYSGQGSTTVLYGFNFAFPVTASANTTLTFTASTAEAMAAVALEYSADRGLTSDIWKSATGTGSAVTTGTSGTTNYPVELLVGCMGQRGQFSSAQTGWLTSIAGSFSSVLQTSTSVNVAGADVSMAFLEQIVAATGTYTAAGTGGAGVYVGVLDTFSEPTATPTATATSTPTSTPTPTATSTATATATSTSTATPTATATASFTPCSCPATPTATATFTPTATATNTPTPTPTATATASYTPCSCPATPTATATFTPTATATSTATPTPSATSTATATPCSGGEVSYNSAQ